MFLFKKNQKVVGGEKANKCPLNRVDAKYPFQFFMHWNGKDLYDRNGQITIN